MNTTIPISLYVHTPWCVQKCPYCDFNSHALKDSLPEKNYIQSLKDEFDQKRHLLAKRPIHTIFIGGGTPSLLSAEAFATLLQHLALSEKTTEVTLEANPGTVEQRRFEAYRQAGINRLSLGIQSFDDQKLQKLGRIHSANEAIKAVEAAQKAGFDNFNLDLMFGLMQQTIAQALSDLRQAIALEPSHLSWYQLTLEPNTLFYKFPPILPDDDYLWKMQQAGQQELAHHDYVQYEISAYARNEQHCQHNLNYWQFGDYLGIGAGAHSKITLADGQVTRHWNHKHPRQYLTAHHKIAEQTTLSTEDLVLEFMLNNARLHRPIERKLFTHRTGLASTQLEAPLRQAEKAGFIRKHQQQIEVTAQGRQYLNEWLEWFVANESH